jgi:hypothetical protein
MFLLHLIISHLLMYFQWEVKKILSHAFVLLIKMTHNQSNCILWGFVYQIKRLTSTFLGIALNLL